MDQCNPYPASIVASDSPSVRQKCSSDSFVHTSLPSDGRSIRLVDLQPSSDAKSNIRCTVRHVYLDDRPTYKSLSYVWGDPNDTTPILIDDKCYAVTANCHAALLRLRETNESCLWIDSICIDQKNTEEKSIQIPLMHDIYAFADEVIVWLGHSKADQSPIDECRERLAFGLMEDLSTYEDAGGGDFDSFVKFSLSGEGALDRWQAFKEIYDHPWFDRLWVHQEITVSSKATVLGQHYSISWERLANAILTLYERINRPSHLWKDNSPQGSSWSSANSQMSETWGLVLTAIWKRDLVLRCLHRSFRQKVDDLYERARPFREHIRNELTTGLSLFELLKTTRTYKCTEPRDRVFAILGLAQDDLGLRPDYAQTASELFVNITGMIIRKHQSLEPLCLAGIGHRKTTNSPQLPSWVVDWRENVGPGLSLPYEYYQAIPSSEHCSVSFSSAPSTLAVSGIHVDAVMVVLQEDAKGDDYWRGLALSLWKERFNQYPTGCDPTHAYIRTITADIVGVGKDRSRLTQELVQLYDIVSRRAWNQYISDFEETLPQNGIDRHRWISEVVSAYAGFIEMRSVTLDRSFFICAAGYMGIGPLTAKEGDMVCVLPGCNVPLLIRKEDDHHLLVGECFIWGLMDGEAIKGKKGTKGYEVFQLR